MPDTLIPSSISGFCCFILRTLYCAKGNYEFGISRIMKSLEPYNKKVGCSVDFAASYSEHFDPVYFTLAAPQVLLS